MGEWVGNPSLELGKNNQQQLLDNPPKICCHCPSNLDQHCPFVLKPPLMADVSEFLVFPPTVAQQQVTRMISGCLKLISNHQNHLRIARKQLFIFDMHLREDGIPGIPAP